MNLTELADAIEAADKKATPRPWSVFGVDSHIIGNDYETAVKNRTTHGQWTHNMRPDDAEAVVDVRNALPAIVAALRWGERAKVLFGRIGGTQGALSCILCSDYISCAVHGDVRGDIDALLAAYPDAAKEPTDDD